MGKVGRGKKMINRLVGITITVAISATAARSEDVYLDKMNKTLDNWWNTLNDVCRGMPGGSDASNLACVTSDCSWTSC